jgi:hypothetical protein
LETKISMLIEHQTRILCLRSATTWHEKASEVVNIFTRFYENVRKLKQSNL